MQPGLPPVSHMPPPTGHDPDPVAKAAIHPPQDFLFWSTFNVIFMDYFLLGFAAFVFSIKSRDCKVMGDREGAAVHGRKAKYLNIAALIVGIFCHSSIVIWLVTDPSVFFEKVLRKLLPDELAAGI